jgi:uncharacterized protein YuzE
MTSTYDKHTDILVIAFNAKSVDESDEIAPGIIADFDTDGNIVAIEILDASQRADDPTHLIHRVDG